MSPVTFSFLLFLFIYLLILFSLSFYSRLRHIWRSVRVHRICSVCNFVLPQRLVVHFDQEITHQRAWRIGHIENRKYVHDGRVPFHLQLQGNNYTFFKKKITSKYKVIMYYVCSTNGYKHVWNVEINNFFSLFDFIQSCYRLLTCNAYIFFHQIVQVSKLL